MRAILINRVISKAEAQFILSRLSKDLSLTAYTMILNQKYPFPTKFINLNDQDKKDISYRSMRVTQDFGEEVIGEIPNSDMLSIKGMSLWHYHKYRIHFLLRNALFEQEVVLQLLENALHITVYSDTPGTDVFLHTEELQNKILYVKRGRSSFKISSIIRVIIPYLIFLVGRFFIGTVQSLKIRKGSNIVLDRAQKQYCLSLRSRELVYDNCLLSNLYAKIDQSFFVIDEVEPPKFLSAKQFKLKKWMFINPVKSNLRIPGEYIVLMGIFDHKIWKKYTKLANEIKDRIILLDRGNLNIYQKWIIQQLLRFHKSTRYYIFRNLAYEKFLSHNNPLTITVTDENSPMVRCIIDAARLCRVKTIGVQHGNVHDLHPAYMLTEGDKSRNVIPDISVLWGEYWLSFFSTVCRYPVDKLKVTGSLRTDIIPTILHGKYKMLEYSSLPNRRIIVYASQPQQDPRLRERAALDVFRAVSRIKDSLLLLKLHPNEEADQDYYIKLAKQAGCSNYSIVQKVDLYLLIGACQMLITCFSTVGTEAVFFMKPLIILDHLAIDLQGYVKQGVGVMACNDIELESLIKKFIKEPTAINVEAYNRFIHANAGSLDGKAAERLISIIKSS